MALAQMWSKHLTTTYTAIRANISEVIGSCYKPPERNPDIMTAMSSLWQKISPTKQISVKQFPIQETRPILHVSMTIVFDM